MSTAGYGAMKKIQVAAGECEPLWLFGMESEYVGFLVSLESEIRILEHIASCDGCRARIKRIIEKAESEDELDELWHRDLPAWMGQATPNARDCPKHEEYTDIENYIDARISWRINTLKVIKTDAELELGHLSERIKQNWHPTP